MNERRGKLQREIEDSGIFECGMLRSWSWRLSAPVRWVGFGGQHARSKAKRALRHYLGKLLGHSLWLDEEPIVTQGFAGEPICKPADSGERPVISVVLPVYNACRNDRRFLLRALESVANQTYSPIELIVVDDGSTDESRQVCMDFLTAHPQLRARCLSKENGGQSGARNFGVMASCGEYVGFLDQDDEWCEDKLERVVPWLVNKDIDVLYTDADCIDAEGEVTHGGIHRNYHCGCPHPKRTVEDILFRDVFVMPGVMTIKRRAFDHIGGFDENLSGYEDDDLFLRLYETCRIFYLPIPTLRWRMYGDNYSSSHRMLASRTHYWRKLLENFADDGANRFRADMISLRFFTQFLSQALLQYKEGNALCWKNLEGAKVILPYLPRLPRVMYSFVFRFPDRIVLSSLQWTRKLIPN